MSSPTITRASLLRGFASLLYGTLPLYSKEEVVASLAIETWAPRIAGFGDDAARIKDATADITFTPCGQLTSDIMEVLYPSAFQNPVIGARLFPAVDKTLSVHSYLGKKLTFGNACPIGMPDMILSPDSTVIGGATFRALIKDATAREAAGSFYTQTEEAWAGAVDTSKIISCPYKLTWGALSIAVKESINVAFKVDVSPIKVQGIGTVDYSITGVTVTVSFVPQNLSEDDLLGMLQPEGLALGSSLRQSKDLVIKACAIGGIDLTVFDAICSAGNAQWKAEDGRVGELRFTASRKLETNHAGLGALFSLGLATVEG